MLPILSEIEYLTRHIFAQVQSRLAGAGVFEIPQPEGPPLKITGIANFVTTRAVAYCFLPSVTALKFIAHLE